MEKQQWPRGLGARQRGGGVGYNFKWKGLSRSGRGDFQAKLNTYY